MKKSFTRLLSLVMLLGFLSMHTAFAAVGIGETKVWPKDGATPAYYKTTDKLMIIYPEPVVASTGSVRLSGPTGLLSVLPATDSRISYAKGDTVEINLSANLKEFTMYSVIVDGNTFKAADDGAPSNVIDPWVFTTGDYTAPVLKSVIPKKDAVVDQQTAYTLEFTFEDASAVLKGEGKVSLYKADGNVWDLIDVASQGVLTGNVLKFSTLRPLEDNTSYQITIGAGTVTDDGKRADGKKNSYAGEMDRTKWTFTTKDFTVPGFASGYPNLTNIGNTSVDVMVKTVEAGKVYAAAFVKGTVVTTVDEIKNAAIKGNVTVSVMTEGKISLTGIGSAAISEEYTVYVIAENNDVPADFNKKWTKDFWTKENTAPKILVSATAVEYKKGNDVKGNGSANASNVVITDPYKVHQDIDNILVTFDEKVKIGAGAVIIRKVADNTALLTVDAASLSIVSDVKVKIPVSGLENNAGYYIQMPNTLVLDLNNNVYGGMTSTMAWRFATNDVIAPLYTILPADGASGVKKDANIVLTFNELVSGGAVTTAYEMRVNGVVSSMVIQESSNDGKFTTYTLNPDVDFPSEAVVVLKINNGAITDLQGNPVAVQGQGTVFVVKDYVGPSLTWKTIPAKPGEAAVLEFNEPVYTIGGGEITDGNLYTILTVKNTDANGTNVAVTPIIDASKKKITITPNSPWGSEKTFYIAITSDLEDVSGNKFDGVGRTATFTIADATPATVDLGSVDGKTIATTDAITLIFKEGSAVEGRDKLYYGGIWNNYMLADMGKVIILKENNSTGPDVAFNVTNGSGDMATFGITIPGIAGNKTYYLGVGPSTKGMDTNVNEPKFVTFYTKSEGVPTVDGLLPVDDSKEVAKGSNFVITYNTNIALVTPFVPGSIYFTDGTTTTNVAVGEVKVDGKVVTINPGADLMENKAYDLYVAAGVFKNTNSSATNTEIAIDAWDFVTKDTKLEVVSLTPDNIATVAIDAKLVIEFAEKVSIGIGYVDIKNHATDALVERINIASGQVNLAGDNKKVEIKATNDFSYNTKYYVEVTNGALIDQYGNKNAAIEGKLEDALLTDWTFTTVDPALAIVKITPKDGADKVATNASIMVEFNREIVSGAGAVGYIEVKSPSADQLQAYPIGSSNVTISGKTLTITHGDKVFPDDSEIFIYLQAGAVKAKTNSSIVNALVDKSSGLSFYTGDKNPPVATVTPGNYNDTKKYEPVDTNISIEFDENVYNIDGTIITNADVTSGGLFTVNDGTNVNFIGSISGRIVTLDPTSNLAENVMVKVTVKGNKIKDGTTPGHAITSDVDYYFTTIDATAPVVSGVAVTTGDKMLTFDATVADANNKYLYLLILPKGGNPSIDEVKAGTRKDVGAPSGSVNHEFKGLNPSTTYEIFYVAEDSRGNVTSVKKAEGSTKDTVKPMLASTKPATGDINVDVKASNVIEVVLTFDEKVQAGAGAITVRDYVTQSVLVSLTEAALSPVADSGEKALMLTIPYGGTMGASKMYVEIADGTIKDKATAPNTYNGLFGKDALAFTTEDNKAPVVDAGSSTNGNVAIEKDITIAFSEDVKAGSATAILYKGSVSTGNAIQVFSASEAVFSGNKAVVNPTANLVHTSNYILAVGAGFAKDLSSNGNNNIATDGITYAHVTFNGNNNPAPWVNTFTPAPNNDIDKTQLENITVDFSEDIYLEVAGNLKPLTLLTQDELKANIKMVDGNNSVITVNQVIKMGSAGFKLTISGNSLKHQTKYTLTISGFMDLQKQAMSPVDAKYTTSDGLAPSITFNPKDAVKDVLVNSPLVLTFSEMVYAAIINKNDTVIAYIDNSNVETFVYLMKGADNVPFKATISGNKVITITPSAALESGAGYCYGLKKTVYDYSGSSLAPGAAGATACFTTKDIVEPKPGDVNATNYAPLGAGTAADAGMWVIFSDASGEIVVSTGSVVIRREDGTIFQKVSGAALSIDDTKLKLKIIHNPFEIKTNYYVELEASVVTDKAGNANKAYSDPVKGWLFTTKDTYALELTAKTPMGSNTPRNTSLRMVFNKDIKTPVAPGTYVAVYKADGSAVYQIEAKDLSIMGNAAVTNSLSLDADQGYYARIEANAFEDGSGNKYAGLMDNSWNFSTVNNIAPEVITLSPADNAKDVSPATSFVMTFSRDIAAGTGMISVRKAVDGTTVEDIDVTKAVIEGTKLTFNLSKLLANKTDYYVIVPAGAITNTEPTKDAYKGISTVYDWNFTTGDFQCVPIKVTATLDKQMECSANVMVAVETNYVGYMLTMNGKDIQPGLMTLDPGTYNFVGTTNGNDCKSTASITVKTAPVNRTDEVVAYMDEAVKYVDAESGIDTMLYAGVHPLPYPNGKCVRTLTVTVTEIMRTPTIAEVQGTGDKSPLLDKVVHIMGTVSGVAPGEGFFVQDANAAWSGIWVEYSSATYEGVQIGNGVSIIGGVAEVANVTSIVADSVAFVPPVLVLAPVMLANPSDLKAEKYESVLVKVDGARASAPAAGTGEWTIYYLPANSALVNDWLYYSTIVKDHYYDVVGIVNARLDNYKLEPRIEPDVKDITVLTGINPVAGSEFKVYPNPFNNQITIDNFDKLTRVVISNVAGQKVIDIEYPTREIRTANLVSGIYVISLYTEDGIAKTERMIKR